MGSAGSDKEVEVQVADYFGASSCCWIPLPLISIFTKIKFPNFIGSDSWVSDTYRADKNGISDN